MGDPKFSRRKYDTPSHPWQGERIAAENEIVKAYGLKNKTELWKLTSLLRSFRQRARSLQAKIRYGDKQAEKERDEFLQRLDAMGIISKEATLDDILSLNVESLLSRRLQTLAYKKGLSMNVKQARQFIVHGHVCLNGRKVTIPGYLVKRSEEESLGYLPHSPLSNDMHPARPKHDLTAETPHVAPQPTDGVSAGVDPSKPTPEAVPAPAEPKKEGE